MQQPDGANVSNTASRESKPMPRPHRCNDRVEDLLQAGFTMDFKDKIQPAWASLKACLQSEPGQEPQGSHVCIKDPSEFLDPHKMYQPRQK